jgi:predicted permease
MDYFNTFALVIRYSTLYIILAKAAIKDLKVNHININTAFLNPIISEEIFMASTKLLKRVFPELKHKDAYIQLNKALYGLK